MKILIILTYYRPWISGLTIYVERLARALVKRGHQVTVLTSHYAPTLPFQEIMNDVLVIRHPVLFRFSKASVMPGFLSHAGRLMKEHDIASVHLPQAEAGPLALIGRIVGTPVVLTYHCDLQLPPGLFNRIIDRMAFISNMMAGIFADRIVSYTKDYAINSPFLSKFLRKISVIYPPVEMPPPEPQAVESLKARFGVNGHRVVGFAARFAAEKGVDCLLGSIPYVLEKVPQVKYIFAGQYKDVVGENVWEELQPEIRKYRDYVEFLGPVPVEEMGNFFGACDILTVPSINSTESFGLVQVEAMLSGCPVVASDLPGVREAVRVTKMGELVPIKDPKALAEGIVRVLENRDEYSRPRSEIERLFSLENTVSEYERLFHTFGVMVRTEPPSS